MVGACKHLVRAQYETARYIRLIRHHERDGSDVCRQRKACVGARTARGVKGGIGGL